MDNRIPAEKTYSDTKQSTPTLRQRQFSFRFDIVYKVLYFVYKWFVILTEYYYHHVENKYMRLSRIQSKLSMELLKGQQTVGCMATDSNQWERIRIWVHTD